MAYEKINFKARQGTGLNRFTESERLGNTFLLTNTPDSVTEPGTPFSVDRLNHMEQGIADAHSAIEALAPDVFDQMNKFEKHTVGKYHPYAVELTEFELAQNRLLKLNYQIIEIALYPELCEKKWVGSTLNATANFWYKCNAAGTRSATGLYMRVEDSRGMFYRTAGQNAVFKGANNTPYNGGAIGEFIGDAARKIEAILYHLWCGTGMMAGGAFRLSNINNSTVQAGATQDIKYPWLELDSSITTPTAYENRPASISEIRYISY